MSLKDKTIDIIVVSVIYLIFILPATILTLPPLLLTTAWFLLPSAYLITRRRKNLAKISFATLLIGLLAFSLDIILLNNHAWGPSASDFRFHIFGVPPEEMLWFFFHIFYIIIWYEHFLDNERIRRISPRFSSLVVFAAAVFVLVPLALSLFPHASRIRYAYLTIGALGMMPIAVYLLLNRVFLLKKFLPLAAFFFLFALGMEIRAVQYGLWAFHDTQNYLGLVTLFGASFPIEEIVFWMILGPSVALAYYELFADDGR